MITAALRWRCVAPVGVWRVLMRCMLALPVRRGMVVQQ